MSFFLFNLFGRFPYEDGRNRAKILSVTLCIFFRRQKNGDEKDQKGVGRKPW